MRLRGTVVAALLVAGACGGDGAPPPVPFPLEAAQIYAEVVRHVHQHDAPEAKRIFVRSTAGGERGDDDAVTIPLDVQAEMADLLRDDELPPMEFVDRPEEVLEEDDEETGTLRDQAVLVRLGLIRGSSDRVTVHVDVYPGRDQQVVTTLLLERGTDGWSVAERGGDGPTEND